MPEPPFVMCQQGAELYDALSQFAWADPENGWAWAKVCEAIGRMRQPAADLILSTEDGHPGWSVVFDVDRCPGADQPIDCLPFLGQLAGVRRIQHLPDVDRRAAIRERRGLHRGRPRAIVSYAMSFTDGTAGAVQLRQRYNPALGVAVDAPNHGQVRIKRSRLLPEWVGRETEIADRILGTANWEGVIPFGLIYTVEITDDLDYDAVRSTYADYDAVEAGATDYADLLRG